MTSDTGHNAYVFILSQLLLLIVPFIKQSKPMFFWGWFFFTISSLFGRLGAQYYIEQQAKKILICLSDCSCILAYSFTSQSVASQIQIVMAMSNRNPSNVV